MTAERTAHLLDWLRDARAMEQPAESMLQSQASRLENYPESRARIEQHSEETLDQQQQIDRCIQPLGGSASVLKDAAGKIAAFGQAVGGMIMTDEMVKGAMFGYVFENIERATYTVLIDAADAAGDPETKRAGEAIRLQEKAVSTWLNAHLPEMTRTSLLRSETPGETARR
ncbi:ferritin-like domain-containing protein [Chitinasiproducens palmae]|uniref:Ferritin-like metal-binding protein YciE n=1 Tax=Chitinasiproducens palmae TaxID=1770053 RepID=A0A1H2PKD8_9BURK|nr:DUF892 family protein [Chitinasiproducens palmae]SDV46894.1 Ferritin-like metal-binding protein YciE [Chitinasiproducens palmae]